MLRPLPCGRGFHEKACLCQQQNLRSSCRGIAQGGGSPLGGEPPDFWRHGGNPPAPAFPLGNGKGESRFLAAAGCFVPPTVPIHLSRNRRLALLPFALLLKHLLPVPVGVLNLKRVLPSRYRTESLSRELVPPRPRSHPNSAICNQTQKLFRPLSFSLPGYSAAVHTLRL
jgi:hypothetical protein